DDVDDATGGERSGNLCQGAGQGSILLGIHRGSPFFLGGQALGWDGSPGRGPTYVWGVFWREHMPGNLLKSELSWEMSPM
ncbi:hypothetical protein AB0899_12185, partial [Streptomyces sp. NPDC007002]|uniref:hypothetical protein n=1 Tax=Streptomyces sp. NPDC007002 TaxID=3156910 RepID=UPI0034532976